MSVSPHLNLKLVLSGLLAVFVIGGSPCVAQEDDAPKAEEILNRFAKVTGGMEAHQKIKSRKQSGVIAISAAGQEIEMEMRAISVYPNKSKVEIDMPTGGTSTRVFDGEHLWEIGGPMGDVLHDEKTTQQTKDNSNFHGVIDWKKNYKTVETVGTEKIDEKTAYKIKCTTEGGSEFFHWFDKESGLMIKTQSNMDIPSLGPVSVQFFHEDYKTIEGIKLSMTTRQVIEDVPSIGTLTQVFKITKTEQNVEVAKDMFDMPEDIKEMMDK